MHDPCGCRCTPTCVPVVLVPAETLSTAKARSVLPTHVRHGDAALNSARAALLVHAARHAPEHLLAATREWLHQEARRESFRGSMDLVDRLRARGHAAVISGAGPSVLVLTTVAAADDVSPSPTTRGSACAPACRPTGRSRPYGQNLSDILGTLRHGLTGPWCYIEDALAADAVPRASSSECTHHMTAAFGCLASLCCMWLHRPATD